MKNAEQRLMAIEHPLTMIIAIALIHSWWCFCEKRKI